MNIGGWCFLVLSWAFIISLLVFCFAKLFAQQRDENNTKHEA